jgi:hypothetical protein
MRATAFRVGAAAWMFTGAVHSVLDVVLRGEAVLDAQVREAVIQLGPIALNEQRLNQGVSLTMGLAMVAVGLLLWMIAGLVRSGKGPMTSFGVVALVASLLALTIAVVLIPGPPVLTLSVASVAFVVALVVRVPARDGAVSVPAVR